MEFYLTLTQTIFYGVSSVVIIVVGVLLIVAVYYIAKITKNVNRISENIEHATEDVKNNIMDAIRAIEKLPFISSFMKRKERKRAKK